MTNISKIESLKFENKKLRHYISVISVKIELIQRADEIRQNFPSSDDSEHIITPIMNKIFKIKSEKLSLQKEFSLD